MRDRARLLREEVALKIAERTGRHLHLSSVVTVMFLLPLLIGTIFGMNTKGLPLTEDEWGFSVALATMLLSAGGIYYVLKRSGMLHGN